MTAARVRSRERGQMLVIVALMMVTLLAFLALLIDAGHIYVQRRLAQNAADAGALAGVRALAYGGGVAEAQGEAAKYVENNGASLTGVNVDIGGRTVTVNASRNAQAYFASILGMSSFVVHATATAEYGYPKSWKGGLMPVAVKYNSYVLGEQVRIWDSAKVVEGPGNISDGQRGWLNFDAASPNANQMKDWVANGYQGKVYVNSWIEGSEGTVTSAMDEFNRHLGRIVYVPLFDEIAAEGTSSLAVPMAAKTQGPSPEPTSTSEPPPKEVSFRIVGFAAFRVFSVGQDKGDKYVQGMFQGFDKVH